MLPDSFYESDGVPTALIQPSTSPGFSVRRDPRRPSGRSTGSVCSRPPRSLQRCAFSCSGVGLGCGFPLASLSGLGMRAVPASDALGRVSQLPKGSCLVVEYLQALLSEALGSQPLPRWVWIVFLPGFLPAPALCVLSLFWKMALGSPGGPLSWDQHAGCMFCCDGMS